ncbi:hypothetical protein [Edaphobacter sp. HDX4]
MSSNNAPVNDAIIVALAGLVDAQQPLGNLVTQIWSSMWESSQGYSSAL